MKKTIRIVLIGAMLLPFLAGARAAERWTHSTDFPIADISSITSDGLNRAWAVSEKQPGGIYAYDNGAWSLQTETGVNLTGIDAYVDDRIYAAGYTQHTGFAYYNDGGGWVLQTAIAGDVVLHGIFTTPWNYTWAVGNQGIIYRNYGFGNWSVHTDTGDDTWYAVDGIDQDNFWILGYAGSGINKVMNWHSTPYAWTILTEIALGGDNRLRALAVVSPPDLWVGGDNGTIIRYDGSEWSVSTNLGTETVTSLTAYPEERESLLAGTEDGKIYRFTGSEWILQTDLGDEGVGALHRPIRDAAWAGVMEKILRSVPVRRTVDFDGDGHSDIAVFRPAAGLWAVRGITRAYFGTSGDSPVPADYNGNLITDIGVFRPSSGLWAVRGITRAYFGRSGDQPIPRDYSGEGRADIAIFRPSAGLWAVRGITRFYFGTDGDYPVPEDYSLEEAGDGTADIMIFRGSSGLWALRGVSRAYFGSSGDRPAVGYYHNADGCSVAIFRPATGLWAAWGVTRTYFGGATDTPVPANYDDDDYRDDIGIFRPPSGLWAWNDEGGRVYFGASGDIPVTR